MEIEEGFEALGWKAPALFRIRDVTCRARNITYNFRKFAPLSGDCVMEMASSPSRINEMWISIGLSLLLSLHLGIDRMRSLMLSASMRCSHSARRIHLRAHNFAASHAPVTRLASYNPARAIHGVKKRRKKIASPQFVLKQTTLALRRSSQL